jgi:hypothetical protein
MKIWSSHGRINSFQIVSEPPLIRNIALLWFNFGRRARVQTGSVARRRPPAQVVVWTKAVFRGRVADTPRQYEKDCQLVIFEM